MGSASPANAVHYAAHYGSVDIIEAFRDSPYKLADAALVYHSEPDQMTRMTAVGMAAVTHHDPEIDAEKSISGGDLAMLQAMQQVAGDDFADMLNIAPVIDQYDQQVHPTVAHLALEQSTKTRK